MPLAEIEDQRHKRADLIDGLRTFAVLAVVLYHLQEGICPGGYAGVDIFFVISGYLIGGGLIRNLKEGTFSLTSFYLRRIRRIMPAYFCLIAAVLAFGCVVLDCDDLRTLGRTVRSSALFITNTYFSRTTGDYFSPAAEENPLLNLWSLSVEEQFYLMIPLTLWLLWKFREKAVKPVLWGALGLSFFAAAFIRARSSSLVSRGGVVDFGPPFRAWSGPRGARRAPLGLPDFE